MLSSVIIVLYLVLAQGRKVYRFLFIQRFFTQKKLEF